jgi:hypothetical protein
VANGGDPGRTIRGVAGSLTPYCQDVFQPMTRLGVLTAEIMNDGTTSVEGDSTRSQILVHHLHQRLTFYVFRLYAFRLVSPCPVPVLREWNSV